MTAAFVLITGLGRSGSTIVQRALTSHPELFIADEAWHVYHAAKMIEAGSRRHYMGLDRAGMCQWLGRSTLQGHQLAGKGRALVGDKCPPAIRYMATIAEMFAAAGAKMATIYTIRHPYDCALSWYERFGAHSLAELAFYKDVPQGQYPVEDMFHQVLDVWTAGANIMAGDQRGAASIVLRYEQLVQDARGTLANACRFLGVPEDERIVASAFSKPVIGGDPKFSKTTEIHTDSVGRYALADANTLAALRSAAARMAHPFAEAARRHGYEIAI
jgi:hypothetical protein